MKNIDRRLKLFDLHLFGSDRESLLISLVTILKEGKKTAYIFTPNPEQVVQAAKNKDFLYSLQQADVLIPDGIGLVVASKLLGLRTGQPSIEERIPGVEVVEALLKIAEREGYRVLLVGGRDYNLGRLPQDNFVWTPGYESVQQPTRAEEDAVRKVIREVRPDIVFVAFGAPWQEQWALSHRSLLEENGAKIVMAVGGSFDFIAGRVARAPSWLRSLGLEWMYRLVREPWRLRRQTKLPQFVAMTFQEFLRN